MSLSQRDKQRLERALEEASEYEKDSAFKSKNGFLNWLTNTGLGYIALKLIDLAWSFIKLKLFGL